MAIPSSSIPGAACSPRRATEPGVILAEIDPALVADARGRIPTLQHTRTFDLDHVEAPVATARPWRGPPESPRLGP